MTFGLTPQGFNAMRLADIKQALENAMIAEFGDINVQSQSVFGQLIGVLSKSYADLWENLEDVYFSQYPNSASGVSLDNVVQLNGITRLPATQTSVVATCAGLEGTYIPINSLANIPSTGDTFFANVGGTITRTNADIVKLNMTSLAAQPYTVILNNSYFTYSLPVITFSNIGDIFVTSNSIVVTLNGISLSAIPFTTDSNTTLGLVATAISGFSGVLSAIVTNPNIITITPIDGNNITVSFIQITGGATQATFAISYIAPGNNNQLTAALTAVINSNTPPWLCVDNMDGTITITTNDPATPFSCQFGSNIAIIYQASPITFLCTNFGPIPCPSGTLNNIVTPIAGWSSVTNINAGNTGTLIETDAQLRIRRQNSIKLLGSATVEAIRAGLLQKVTGVTNAFVYENTSLQQAPIIITFPAPFQSSDIVTVTYNDILSFMVTCPSSPDQATSMGLLVTAFEALPMVSSASYGGSGNQTLTVISNISTVLAVDNVVTSVSSQIATISGGRPPKSFECVVQGGSDENIANQIWITKPAGIETYGNTSYTIVDSQGDNQTLFFSRPTVLYIWVQVALTLYAEETFPVNGVQLVAQSILNYGNSLGVGIDVLFQRVLAQIFTVPGIASGNMMIAATPLMTDSPSFSTSDITIQEDQISVFNLELITVTVV